MNIIERFASRFIKKVFDPLENIDLNKVVGWHSVGGSSVYSYYRDNQYENGYSSIRVLADGFAMIEQYTIDKTGKSVPSNILDRLYTPNTDMSAYDFREALMVTTLVHNKVRLRVHHKGTGKTQLNADSITGFTFMEGYNEKIVGGKRYYMMPNGEELDDTEVITLKSVNPYNVNDGFSASAAAKRWTRLDDYIADYQKGFFENGAVPAGEMIITARTVTEFNDIVDNLQAKHKGAGRNNNITYTHRPTDANGAPLNAQVEWVPFSVANKDMSLKELFENVNKKIDSVYGVPSEIRGFLSNSNYSSVSVAEKVMVKYALNPKTLKIWSKFTHELNRITGGTGVAISYDLEIPVIADEDKVEAEAKGVDAQTVATLTSQGFTLESAVEYVKKGDIGLLILGEPAEPDEPDIVDGEDIKDTPQQPIDVYSKGFTDLGDKMDKVMEAISKTAIGKVKTKQLSDIDKALYEYKFEGIVRSQMSRQVDRAVEKLDEAIKSKAFGDSDQEEDKQFTAEILALMLPLMVIYGNRTVNTGMNLILQAGLKTDKIKNFEFTPKQRKAYEKYLAKLGSSYSDQTAEQIRQVLGKGILEGATKAQIEDELRRVILGPENEYRVARLARTEVNLSEGRASVNAMQNIQDQTGYKIYKVWHTSGSNPCPFCSEMAGTEKLVHEAFLGIGDSVVAGDSIFNNDWTKIESAELHANCNCYTTYRVAEG